MTAKVIQSPPKKSLFATQQLRHDSNVDRVVPLRESIKRLRQLQASKQVSQFHVHLAAQKHNSVHNINARPRNQKVIV